MKKIKKAKKTVPVLTTKQMIEVDRLMIEKYKIELIQMMENAGRCLAIVAMKQFLKNKPKKKTVIVLAGTGGNGGGAMVAARRLHNWGAKVKVYLTAGAESMTPIPKHQLDILKNMGVSIFNAEELSVVKSADLIIDGVIGYSIKGDPFGLPKHMIEWANKQETPTLSLDTPSGLDLTSGTIHTPTIKANATLTLALPKQGLFEEAALPYRGDLYLGDISVPPSLYAEETIGISVSPRLFSSSDIIGIDVKKKVKIKKEITEKEQSEDEINEE